MSSQKRIEASRRNGALSRGPKTEAGKRRSSANSTKHGLTAKLVVTSEESEAGFIEALQGFLDKFKPRDPVEQDLVEQMAISHWRLRRAFRIERLEFDRSLTYQQGDADERLDGAWRDLSCKITLPCTHRYQVMLQRAYDRSLRNLLLLRKLDDPNNAVQNEPKPVPEHSSPSGSKPSAEPQPEPVSAVAALRHRSYTQNAPRRRYSRRAPAAKNQTRVLTRIAGMSVTG